MNAKNNERKTVVCAIICVTLAFFLMAAAGLLAAKKAPEMRIEKIENALAEGDTKKARRIIGRLNDETAAAAYTKECTYLEADMAFQAQDWESAASAFASLGNYEDAAERSKEAQYRHGDALAERGEWEAALAAFESLTGYSDAAGRRDECRYEYAAVLAQSSPYEAFDLYAALGDYKDARQKMIDVAVAETGETDAEAAVNQFKNLSPAEVERRAALKERRDALPVGILDVGFYHTVALTADGSVLACGSNEFGQCDTAGLNGVTQIAAGAYHTAALLADGTVAAVGRSSEGQCDTADWSGIIAVAASDYATFGLKDDGTVVFCGYQPAYYRNTPAWQDVTQISGGSYGLVALHSSGTAYATHESACADSMKDLVGIVTNTGYAVGLNEDGTVTSPKVDLSNWTDIVALSCSGTGIVGLKSDGSVVYSYFRPLDAPDFSALQNAVAIACGGTHFAWVEADGSVHVIGDTDLGQGDTAEWNVF